MILLDGQSLTLDALVAIAVRREPAGIAPAAVARVRRARAIVDRHAAGTAPVYGINTGFGSLAEVAIPRDKLSALQVNLLRSHASGVGEPLDIPAVRATLALRANVLAKGFSGIRLETLQALLNALNAGVHPRVPSRGSVGASGDLAPLAHLALVLIGEGEALAEDGSTISGLDALRAAGLTPVSLEAKEGLALINGTQPSAALLGLAVAGAGHLARAADVAAALSIDALKGSTTPFDQRIHDARGFAGQKVSAANIRALLEGSAINASHAGCGRVQDAYSLRCAAQVHGAARDAIAYARHAAETEANAGTDNPMVFVGDGESHDSGEIVSGGNFHGAPVAIAADLLAIGLVHLATIAERRTDRMMNPALSGLPPFLTRDSGLHSGFMMAQVASAALTSELKTLAHPASVDTIPTSASREDHVSMSMGAALKCRRSVELAARVIAIEIMCACQAIDLLAPLETSPRLRTVHAAVRRLVPGLGDDRPPSPDIETITGLILSGALTGDTLL
ncbi:MAG: histidine ammonia-lyase [Acidobacteriota bacterium]|nr:histidine ammonia-lyase [Acidobacteriota bacterium]